MGEKRQSLSLLNGKIKKCLVMKLQHMQKVPCSKLSCFPNFRKIIFFSKLIGLSITKSVWNCYFICQQIQPWRKKKRNWTASRKKPNGKGSWGSVFGPLFTSEKFLCKLCALSRLYSRTRLTSLPTKLNTPIFVEICLGTLGRSWSQDSLVVNRKAFMDIVNKNYT